MKYIYYLSTILLFSLLICGCSKRWFGYVTYKVHGTKTNLTIEYRDFSSEGDIEEIKTVFVEKLPWSYAPLVSEYKFNDKNYKKNIKSIILKASSKSEGKMFVSVSFMNHFLSADTTNDYIEIFF